MPRNSSNFGFLALNMKKILLCGTHAKLGAQPGFPLSLRSFFFWMAEMPRNSSNSGFLALNMNNVLLCGTQQTAGATLVFSLSSVRRIHFLALSGLFYRRCGGFFWSEPGFLPLFAVLIIYGVQRLRKIAFVFRPKDILFDSNSMPF